MFEARTGLHVGAVPGAGSPARGVCSSDGRRAVGRNSQGRLFLNDLQAMFLPETSVRAQ